MLKHEASGEVLSIPAHRSLKIGTLNKLLRDVGDLTGLTRNGVMEKLKWCRQSRLHHLNS
jgi:hypothetical protein